MHPVVLVTTDRRDGAAAPPGPRVRPKRPEAWIGESYVEAVRAAGGIPLLCPPGESHLDAVLERVDAIVLTGGHFDIHPSHYGEAVSGRLDRVEQGRTEVELWLARVALERAIPLLGICGGMQAMAVAAGGRLIQDLPSADDAHLAHEQPTDPAQPWHDVRIADPATRWLGTAPIPANSTHHQAVADPGAGLVACGWTDDGVIEVIASPGPGFALGVQWHPELLGDHRPYQALVDYSRPS